jgi:tRNA(Leu) C34 or U34 (ribose-2'-O)-methylase TrmL
MVSGMRSLNVATAAAIVLSEALRQTGLLPVVEADKIRHMGTP